jgi:hypothetical protein
MDALYYLIGTDGRYYGPLTADDVRTWLLDGRASRYSRARRDTEERWQSLREMQEFESTTQPPVTGGGAAQLASAAASGIGEVDIDTRPPVRLDPVECFRRAWRLLMRDFAALAGWALGAEIVITATLFLPDIGPLVVPIADALLTAAVYALYLARMRGLRPSVREIASTVGVSAVPIVVANMAQFAVLGVAATLVRVSVDVTGGSAVVTQPVVAALGVLLLTVGVYLAIGYALVVPLIIDRRLPVWRALETSRKALNPNWLRFFFLQLLASLSRTLLLVALMMIARSPILLASALPLGLALVLTLPLAFAVLMVAYRDLFPE